jgi:hypothetical protein
MTKQDENINIFSNVENLELYSDHYPFRLSLKISNFENDADYKRFISNCEMLVRRCNEYKLWKGYIIDVLGINTCMITNEEINEVSIEVHHHVPTLKCLMRAIVNKKIENSEEFCSFDIAQEAIELHFKNKVGYVTLIKSMHEKFHNGYLDIPIEIVRGDYQHFMETYSKFLDQEDLDSIHRNLAINKSNCDWSKDNYPIAKEM